MLSWAIVGGGHGIFRIQPIISGIQDEKGDVKPFARTVQTMALMLQPLPRLGDSRIVIEKAILDPRIRDIKFKKKTAETGVTGLFSDNREPVDETLQDVQDRTDSFHDQYLVEEPAADTLRLIVCHTTIARLLATKHAGQSLTALEASTKALYNLQGLEFHPAGVFTIFEGFPTGVEDQSQMKDQKRFGAFNIIRRFQ